MAASVVPFKSLDGASSTGAGSVLDLGGLAKDLQLVYSASGFASSSPFSSMTIAIEGSLDGTVWYRLVDVGPVQSGEPSILTSSSKLARFVRANLTQLAPGGGSPVITAVIAVGGE